eukprot:scaffold1390_cov249-Pinguiococcus_pyrenoidosus.AAC.1
MYSTTETRVYAGAMFEAQIDLLRPQIGSSGAIKTIKKEVECLGRLSGPRFRLRRGAKQLRGGSS